MVRGIQEIRRTMGRMIVPAFLGFMVVGIQGIPQNWENVYFYSTFLGFEADTNA